ncbi:MAG: histidine--tRNA ligase [Kiritimatiellae bacterium]|nr:histidine--tRNA ligase [Kiritimatiellia bacterium]
MASDEFLPIKGMSDIISPEVSLWQLVESRAREVFHAYGLTEIRTPILEREELFIHSLGNTTDVVQKEMFTLDYQGKMRLTLRPEGTAGVIRSLAGAGPDGRQARVYYLGPMFRAERPQAGRRRQFHQIGAELTGEANPLADAECLAMQAHLLKAWGLSQCRIKINTRGLPEDRAVVADGLRTVLKPHLDGLCEDCRRRYEQNVLRVLDCKNPACGKIVEGLPSMTSFMSEASRSYFEEVQYALRLLNLEGEVTPRLVRGLDYYAHTVWEISHPGLGAQDALSGGGRYQIMMNGKPVDGVGFALGMERVLAALNAEGVHAEDLVLRPKAWLVSLGEAALKENLLLAMTLRRLGVACGMDLTARSMKAQMRAAGKSGAAYVLIRGDAEMEKGVFQVKDMVASKQEEQALPEIMSLLLPDITPPPAGG